MMLLPLPLPPLPLKIFAVIILLLLLSSSPLDINRGGLLFAEASRAYPHGCLYRHPSYYTYDERDDISWFNHQNNYDETFSAQLSTAATTTAAARSIAASEFTDYRKLPPKNHPIRRTYQQYKLLRRLGAGKFSNVFEAVDVYMAAATVHANNNNDDDAIQKKQRRKKITSTAVEQNADDALSNEATTTTDSSDNESTTSQPSSSSSSAKPSIDPNTLVVLKCLKPISERKIRRELLVLTHCQNLPNLARLIGIVIPSSMDLEEENNDGGKGAVVDDKERNDGFNEKRVNGGEKESRRHHQSLQHHQQQQHHSHNHRKRRRYSHRTLRQSQQQQHNQQRRRQHHQDIGSITTDAHNLPEKDVNLANKKNVNNGNNGGNKKNNSNSQQQHGEQIPALVLEHAGQRAQWFCHGPRPPPSSSTTNKTAESNMYRGRHSYQNHLTEYEMKYYLCHLLIALDGLHAAGIMHRDVKPRNTLINLNSEPVFAASLSSEERKSRSSGMMMGSCASSIVQSSNSTPSSSSSQSHSSTTLPSTLPPPPLMLVDLGLADFYLPGKEFNVRVASRHYKSPELLIGYEYYDYAIDMWSVGCILAGLLFRIEPFFRGVDNEDQLGQIVNCLGTRDFLPYCRKCNVRLSSKARAAIGKYCSESSSSSSSSSEDSATPISFSNSDIGRRKPWLSYLTPDCPIPSSEATDLLDKLLVYDHEQRWTAREALGHAFFDEVRDEVWNEVQERILWESQRRSLSSTSV